MMKPLRSWVFAIALASLVGGSFMAVASPSTSYAAECPDKNARVLGFPYWYRNLSETKGSGTPSATCEITSPGNGKTAVSDFIWKLALNIVEIAMVAVGYIAVGFIIYGGFKYITGAGASDKIVTGRKLILNAVIGLVISLFAVAIVNIVLGSFS